MYLSLSKVHSSPPRHGSRSMYRYLLSLNVLYNLTKDKDRRASHRHVPFTDDNNTVLRKMFPLKTYCNNYLEPSPI